MVQLSHSYMATGKTTFDYTDFCVSGWICPVQIWISTDFSLEITNGIFFLWGRHVYFFVPRDNQRWGPQWQRGPPCLDHPRPPPPTEAGQPAHSGLSQPRSLCFRAAGVHWEPQLLFFPGRMSSGSVSSSEDVCEWPVSLVLFQAEIQNLLYIVAKNVISNVF